MNDNHTEADETGDLLEMIYAVTEDREAVLTLISYLASAANETDNPEAYREYCGWAVELIFETWEARDVRLHPEKYR